MVASHRLSEKPKKPSPLFPMFAHARGYWCAKIAGKQWNFGPWDDPDGALKRYSEWRPMILAGIDPRASQVAPVKSGALTIKEMCNRFIASKEVMLDEGELTERNYVAYVNEVVRIVDTLGRDTLVESLTSEHFAKLRASYPETWGLTTRGDHIVRTRTIFSFAYDDGLIDRAVNFGSTFRKATKKQHRRHNQKALLQRGSLALTADEVNTLLASSSGWLKASILLGVQAGLGNTDVSRMTTEVVDFEKLWVTYPRGKTGVVREFPLWPETVVAMKAAMSHRPVPVSETDGDLVFLTSKGRPLVWDKVTGKKYCQVNNLTTAFGKLLHKCDLKRMDVNFYSLRRTFATAASGCKDQVAVNYIMGHSDSSMEGLYRQGIEPQRMIDVVAHVHQWLYGHSPSI